MLRSGGQEFESLRMRHVSFDNRSDQKSIAEELDRSHSYGGRSVFGWEPPPADSSDRVGAIPQLPSR